MTSAIATDERDDLDPTPRPDELPPDGAAYLAKLAEAEMIAAANPHDGWHRRTPEERAKYVTQAAVMERRAMAQAKRAGFDSISAYLEATGDRPKLTVVPDIGTAHRIDRFLALELDPVAWIVGDLIPKGPAVGGLFGAEKAGKSLFGLQLAFAVAMGSSIVGFPVEIGGPTLFIEYEGSKAALQKRARMMAAKYGVLTDPLDVFVCHRPDVKLDTDAGEAWLTKQTEGMVLCIVGPVSKAATMTKENDPAEWQRLAERLQRASDATGCTILLVHHTRKPDRQMGPPSKVADFMNAVRGSNAYLGAVDVALGVQRDPESTEGVLYYLERDGASGRAAYTFDPTSLCVWPDDRPLRKPSADDRAAAVLDFIGDHPGTTKAEIVAALQLNEETLRGYLIRLASALDVEDHGPGRAKTYRAKS